MLCYAMLCYALSYGAVVFTITSVCSYTQPRGWRRLHWARLQSCNCPTPACSLCPWTAHCRLCSVLCRVLCGPARAVSSHRLQSDALKPPHRAPRARCVSRDWWQLLKAPAQGGRKRVRMVQKVAPVTCTKRVQEHAVADQADVSGSTTQTHQPGVLTAERGRRPFLTNAF